MLADGLVHAQGITPAWAGKRSTEKRTRRLDGDHPRVGGEKYIRCSYVGGERGSPPRGRGKDGLQYQPRGMQRITPAWAGKSVLFVSILLTYKDHPRVGGEKTIPPCACCGKQGSPPRGRGKAGTLGIQAHGLRITPAWAGKS